jgi:hypothetical protein
MPHVRFRSLSPLSYPQTLFQKTFLGDDKCRKYKEDGSVQAFGLHAERR